MKVHFYTLFIGLASPTLRPVDAQSCISVTTVQNFDLTNYTSAPWYVQEQAENFYTRRNHNRCVTAQYKPKDRNQNFWSNWWGYTVDVFNYAEDESGNSFGGRLCAVSDSDTSSKLKVAPCFVPQSFGGPYWVVAYRESSEDGYALVSGGQPSYIVDEEFDCGETGTSVCCKTGDGINNSGLWILTRQANPSEALVEEVLQIAKRKGFATNSILFEVFHDGDCNVPGINGKFGNRGLRKRLEEK